MNDNINHIQLKIDLELAAAVQNALLTAEIPSCQCGKMALKYRMSDQVGGDFYFFHQLGQDQIALAIGDVMGHGMGAALLMTLIMGHLRADRQNHRQPAKITAAINELLLQLGEQLNNPVICSLIYAVVDLPSGLLLYVNAGHPHPVILNRDTLKTSHLPPTTILLGVQPQKITESCHQFAQKDRLVLFTDGLSETQNPDRELFKEKPIRQIFAENPGLSPDQIAQLIFQKIDLFRQDCPQQDDQTLVIIDFDNVSTEL